MTTDAGLTHLQELKELEYLDLRNTQVTDAALAHLRGLSKLKRVWLYNTKVTEEGMKSLQESLPKCRIDTSPEFPP
jgi:Leucine-rich repeat (LRR) protein